MPRTPKNKRPSTGFGQRLKSLREAANLSQAELGKLSQVHWNTIAKIERDEVEPGWGIVVKLANTLNVSVAAFMPREETSDGNQERLILTRIAKEAAKAAGLKVTTCKRQPKKTEPPSSSST